MEHKKKAVFLADITYTRAHGDIHFRATQHLWACFCEGFHNRSIEESIMQTHTRRLVLLENDLRTSASSEILRACEKSVFFSIRNTVSSVINSTSDLLKARRKR